MQNPKEVERNLRAVLDLIGGEPLAGSGFELESPDLGFDADESATEGGR